MIADDSGNAPLCNKALELKEDLFPFKYGNGGRYINISKVINKEETGFIQKLKPLENKILSKTYNKLNGWRKENYLPKEEVHNLYYWIDKEVKKFYSENFNL